MYIYTRVYGGWLRIVIDHRPEHCCNSLSLSLSGPFPHHKHHYLSFRYMYMLYCLFFLRFYSLPQHGRFFRMLCTYIIYIYKSQFRRPIPSSQIVSKNRFSYVVTHTNIALLIRFFFSFLFFPGLSSAEERHVSNNTYSIYYYCYQSIFQYYK